MKMSKRKKSNRLHQHRHVFFLAVCMMILFFKPVASAAAELTSVGIITDVQGEATVIRSDDQKIGAKKNLPLYPGDEIETGENGVVSFAFNEGDTFRLNQDSRVSLDELSGSDEENPPVLQLSLGFLWSKIKLLLAQQNRPVVHTPTAVIGVRGTEFDTVVTEDSSSAVTVDDGSVEVETDDDRRVIRQGLSAEVDLEQKIGPTAKAIPVQQRNWQKYRREKKKKLIAILPRHTTRLRKRFEINADRFMRFSKKISVQADRMNRQIKKFEKVIKKRDRTAIRRQLLDIKVQEQLFRPAAKKYRKAVNRVRVIGRNTLHIKKVFEPNRHRFGAEDIELIETNLAAISQKIRQIIKIARSTNKKIRQSYRQIKKLHTGIKKQRPEKKRKSRSKTGQSNPKKPSGR